MDDFEIMDGPCPKCGHGQLRYRDCTNFCEDGMLDEADFDAINFMPGEEVYPCQECKGTGSVTWCPKCGTDLTGVDLPDNAFESPDDPDQLKLNF